jgi:hypothetical protein
MSRSNSNKANECNKQNKTKINKKPHPFVPVWGTRKMTFLLLALVFAGNVTKTKQSIIQ